jgi:hypothetical protein
MPTASIILEDIFKLIKKMKETDADMVIGSRKGQKVHNIYRHVVSR